MRKRAMTTLLVAALSLGSVAPVFAEEAKPKPARRSAVMLTEAAPTLQQLVAEYQAAMKAREKALKLINETFTRAVAAARVEYAQAMARANNAGDESEAAADLSAAIRKASKLRAAAKLALGPAPVNPETSPDD